MSLRNVRAHNRTQLLQQILRSGPLPRSVLADLVGLTPAAVTRISRELIDAGVLVETQVDEVRAARPGRPFVHLALGSRGVFVGALHLEAFTQVLALANLHGEVIAERVLRLDSLRDRRRAIARIAQTFAGMIDASRVTPGAVVGLGVVVPGTVDPDRGVVVDSPSFGWHDVALVEELAARLDVPIALESILNATNIAETEVGACRGSRDVVLMRVSFNIGVSTIASGKLVRGSGCRAGQIAHLPVPNARRACHCGQVGCLETVASGRAILADLGMRAEQPVAGNRLRDDANALQRVIGRVRSADRKAISVVARAGRRAGELLATVAVLLAPDAIVFGGPIGSLDPYVSGAREAMESALGGRGYRLPRLATSVTDGRAAAVRLALSEFVFSSRFRAPASQAAA